ncbi:hypothetical protein MRX96_029298 [Rhipicephalus microplus]
MPVPTTKPDREALAEKAEKLNADSAITFNFLGKSAAQAIQKTIRLGQALSWHKAGPEVKCKKKKKVGGDYGCKDGIG